MFRSTYILILSSHSPYVHPPLHFSFFGKRTFSFALCGLVALPYFWRSCDVCFDGFCLAETIFVKRLNFEIRRFKNTNRIRNINKRRKVALETECNYRMEVVNCTTTEESKIYHWLICDLDGGWRLTPLQWNNYEQEMKRWPNARSYLRDVRDSWKVLTRALKKRTVIIRRKLYFTMYNLKQRPHMNFRIWEYRTFNSTQIEVLMFTMTKEQELLVN